MAIVAMVIGWLTCKRIPTNLFPSDPHSVGVVYGFTFDSQVMAIDLYRALLGLSVGKL